MTIAVVVAAKNEEACLAACLASLERSIAYARQQLGRAFRLRVVCDDCTDATESIARSHDVDVLRSSGGKIAAQRLGAGGSWELLIFADADVHVSKDAILELVAIMGRVELDAASVPRVPVRPASSSLVAEACWVYNLRRGFRREPGWISGRLFAVRSYDVPDVRKRSDAFLALHEGLRAEDLYLSRVGRTAETERGAVYFRPPETIRGMYRYYRRLRREIERTDALCPGLSPRRERRLDLDALRRAPLHEQRAYRRFARIIAALDVVYRIDRAMCRAIGHSGAAWPVVTESKRPIDPEELSVESDRSA